jgi:16S rRNA (guanine966-N2)-methyltransferase
MRVISGTAKGTPLRALPGSDLRPTSDIMRGAFFASVQWRVPGSVFLDCCAGTGAVGIEALSRGASLVVFIEQSPKALAVLRENLSACRLAGKGRVLKGDFRTILRHRTPALPGFDLVYFDPPYAAGLYADFLNLIVEKELLVPEGIAAVECSRRENPIPVAPEGLTPGRRLEHGQTVVQMFVRERTTPA